MQYYSMIKVYNEYIAKMTQNAISVELKFKFFLGGMPPDPYHESPLPTIDSYIYSYICSSFLMMKLAKSLKICLTTSNFAPMPLLYGLYVSAVIRFARDAQRT